LWEKTRGHGYGEGKAVEELALDSAAQETKMVRGAIRTDLILSAEITAIALADLSEQPLLTQAASLALVGLLITFVVYGAVALIVKMDDFGLHLSQRSSSAAQAAGRALVKAMPVVLSSLAWIGTLAMLWVGGGILVHGLHEYHWDALPNLIEALAHPAEALPGVGPVTGWLAHAVAYGIVGLIVGGLITAAMHLVPRKGGHAAH
jgi:predicted DNA repair protein MutK